MATLTIRNVPTVHADALKVRAAAAGKSVEQLLRDVVAELASPPIKFGCRPEWRLAGDAELLAPLDADELDLWSS